LTQTETQQVGLTAEDIAQIRRDSLDDPFYFARVICGHRDLTDTLHMPLLYVAAGLVDKLIPLLNDTAYCSRSYTIRAIQKELARHSVDWNTPQGKQRMHELFRIVNIRVARGYGKSSAMTHALRLWKMTRDPNLTACVISNTDPKATDFCKQIRATILSPLYGIVFHDRLPSEPKFFLKENSITLAGRTVPDKEPSLMAFGHKSSPVGYHFDEIQTDDLVARENRSPAELAEVRDFLANMFGLYNPGIRFPIRRLHVGTRWDEEDDDAMVRQIQGCFTVNVPAWYREDGADDILKPGIPTDPQWKTLESILELQTEVLSDLQQGSIAWRCNYELDPAIGGGRIFPAALVDSSDWLPFKDEKVTEGKEWPMRHMFDAKNNRIPAKHEDGTPKTLNGQPLYRSQYFDPRYLYTVMAFDQAFSDDGDPWAGVCMGMDQYGHRYVLETRTGQGMDAMLDAMLMLYLTWRPRRCGQEKIQAEQLIQMIFKLDEKYRRIRGLIEPIPHNNVAKEYRIRNYVAEVMKMRRLWLNPHESFVKDEMKKYKPGKNAKDNILDALAMCEVLIRKSAKPKDGEKDYKEKFRAINSANRTRRDQRTGVQLW
jgi:hypothetical protein